MGSGARLLALRATFLHPEQRPSPLTMASLGKHLRQHISACLLNVGQSKSRIGSKSRDRIVRSKSGSDCSWARVHESAHFMLPFPSPNSDVLR